MTDTLQIILACAGINILLVGWLRLDLGRRVDRLESDVRSEIRELRGEMSGLRERLAKLETLVDIIRAGMQQPRSPEEATYPRE